MKLAKAFRESARHCLAAAKQQQTLKARLQWLEKGLVWLELARQAEERMDCPPQSETTPEGVGFAGNNRDLL